MRGTLWWMTTRGYRWVLVAVVIGYAGLALAVSNLHRFLAYDEAIYLSQVYPVPALPFTAPRARGLPLLLVPLGRLDAPIPVIRGYLLVLEAGLMFVGFNAWLPVLRARAVIAAAAFGICWLPLFYATEVFPNLPAAFGALAASGYWARYLDRSRAWSLARASAPAESLPQPDGQPQDQPHGQPHGQPQDQPRDQSPARPPTWTPLLAG